MNRLTQQTDAIISIIFEERIMIRKVLLALAVLFVTGMFIALMYAGI
jgi:hypothetical protein